MQIFDGNMTERRVPDSCSPICTLGDIVTVTPHQAYDSSFSKESAIFTSERTRLARGTASLYADCQRSQRF